jgi:long-chain fatty acid transport protein
MAACTIVGLAGPARGQGIYFPGVGAVNQSMGGASAAAPVDALGAMLWNPAVMSGIPESQVDISSAFFIPNIFVSSSSPLGGAGTTRSDSGLVPVANTAVLFRFEEYPRITFGMASYYAGAGGANFPGDPTNPVFAAKFPAIGAGGLVLGPSVAQLAILQTAGLVSLQLTDRLSVGAGPVVDTILASFAPAFFGGVNNAMGTTLFSLPTATGGRAFWGGGFKVGAFYHLLPRFDVGLGYTSPQWIDTPTFYSRDQVGNPLTILLPMRLPAVYSGGFSVKPSEQLLVAVDCRFIDNSNSTPFGQPPISGGLGWNDIFAAAVGARYQFGTRLAAMLGYSYNTPVFPGARSLFNVQAPTITQHVVSAGVTARIAENFYASLAYAYFVHNSVTGSALQIPGGSTTITSDLHSIFLTMTVKFGTPARHAETVEPHATVEETAPVSALAGTSASKPAQAQ